jgi:CHAT domain-containing protein
MNLYTDPEVSDIYRGFERVLIEQHRIDKALEVGEQGRSKGFVDFLANRLPARSPFIPSVSPLSIYQIKRLAKEQNSTLVEYSLVYDYDQFYERSQDDLGIHEIYTYAQELLIWVISPQGQMSFKQVDLTPLLAEYQISLANLVRTVREAIALGEDYLPSIPGNLRAYGLNEQLQLLYQVLIEPIAHFLPTEPNSRITIIPQDFLFLLPFAALQDPKGQWLISKYSLLSSPSLHVLEWMRQKRQRLSPLRLAFDLPVTTQFKTSTVDPLCDRTAKLPLNLYPALVLGNPTMPSFSMYFGEAPLYFTRLPGAELEAKAVGEVLNVTPLTNDAATREAVLEQMPGAKIIHLATHSCLGYRECFQGILALAPDAQGKNGFLTLRDIFNLSRDRKKLPLSADLVCLSGCDIARGQIWGDGVFQISQALLVAGASSMMMSLWLPPPASSPAMMKQFYQQFQATGDKAQSLRQAMLTTLEKFPEPKYWAGFTLFGCG